MRFRVATFRRATRIVTLGTRSRALQCRARLRSDLLGEVHAAPEQEPYGAGLLEQALLPDLNLRR